jgi:CheY-like chemotaxis protein
MTRILVVDDVAVVRLVISRILKKAGYQVIEAADGAEALTIAATEPLDLVITDLWMPGTNGADLLQAMSTHFPAVALMAMTGGSPQATLAASLEAGHGSGALMTLMKPIDKNELLEAIPRALSRAGQKEPI